MKNRLDRALHLLLLAVVLLLINSRVAKGDSSSEPINSAQESKTPSDSGNTQDLAQKLQNPVASLISVPFQNNWNFGVGPDNDMQYVLNIQPVIPMSLGKKWNLIFRPIFPIIVQPAPALDIEGAKGIGDLALQTFFSPNKTEPVIWGAGLVFVFPSASDEILGNGKWSLGPTFVVLKQKGPWTFGLLANHVWSYAGSNERSDVSLSFFQPFVSYTWPSAWSITLNTETNYNWKATSGNHWTVPINLSGSKVFKIGKQPISLGFGPRFFAESPAGGSEWGLRLAVTLLFPK